MLWIDPIYAGRVLSILCGFGAMIMIGELSRELYGQRPSKYACWLYIVSPLIYQLNLRVLTESLFQFLMLASAWMLLRFFKNNDDRSGSLFIFVSGLAMLTRPEAILYAPLVLAILVFSIKNRRNYVASFTSLIPWTVYLAWNIVNSGSESYNRIFVANLAEFHPDKALERLISYVDLYPYVAFYPIFFMALVHIIQNRNAIWKRLVLYIHISYAAILFLHPAWSTRFLLIPLSFFIVETSAHLPAFRRLTAFLVLSTAFVFSVSAIFLQRHMFEDFKIVGSTVGIHFPASNSQSTNASGRVYSDEQVKTSYYARQPVKGYDHNTKLNPGDLLIVHSFYTDLSAEKRYLNAHYRYHVLQLAEYSIVPVLGDTLGARYDLTNSPVLSTRRFEKQRFQSVLVKIDAPLTAGAPIQN